MNSITRASQLADVALEDQAPSGKIAIGKLLYEAGRIKREDVERVKKLQAEKGLRFGEAAISLGVCSEDDILRALSRQFAFDWIAPTETKLASELSVVFDPFGRAAEALRTVRGQLLLRWFDQGNRTLSIIGLHSGAGVSHVTANLAVLFAQLGMRTLLIDANLRNPRQEALFAVKSHAGLSDMLVGRAAPDSFNKINQIANLWLLSAGPIPPNPQELLARPSFYNLLQSYQKQFDVVLIDTPAFDIGADAEVIASRARGALVVARKDVAKAKVARQLQQDLAGSGVTLCGAVLNEY